MKEIIKKLITPFEDKDVNWKVQTANGSWATCVAYVDSRQVAKRLDWATGGMWQDEYREVGGLLICRIGIYCSETKDWIWREDTGTESMTEKEKGIVSDAFKRAAVKWGVGRDLYDLPMIAMQTVKNKKNKDVPSLEGKAIYADGVNDTCRKLIQLKGKERNIYFKSNEQKL